MRIKQQGTHALACFNAFGRHGQKGAHRKTNHPKAGKKGSHQKKGKSRH
jgi:hypothetical protein